MKERIEAALAPLVGLPWWGSHHAADLQCFHFGAHRLTTTHKGEPTVVGDYALHLQCGWRITGRDGIIVARRDLYYPAGDDPYTGRDDFDWDRQPNRRGQRIEALLREHADAPLTVLGCTADRLGGFRLELARDHALEVFPDDSLGSEHWWLLRPGPAPG
jgi:hypothetical protein